jgi:ADP-ribose pyrophosphatase
MSDDHSLIWQLIASRIIFRHPRICVSEDTVILPSGRQTEWMTYADGHDFVKVICVDAERRVLVARQYCHAPRRVVHEFPGGEVGDDESHADAAWRELLEEIGLYARRLEPLGSFLTNSRRSAKTCYLFLATDLIEQRATPDQEEFIAYEWLPIALVDAQIRAGAIANGVLLAAWCLFKSRHDIAGPQVCGWA